MRVSADRFPGTLGLGWGCRIKRKVLKTIASQTKSEKIRLRPDFFHKKTSQTSKSLTHLVKYKYATTKYFTG